ncbi:unnamed protein product, partial [Mesorhabditis belari]|uniref:Uncharacterized protein n=1 Tax=Mesorhabditis belari TaxID=2138241 RepID=A0AAF3EYC2_9BILA
MEYIDAQGEDPDCCREKRKLGFRPLSPPESANRKRDKLEKKAVEAKAKAEKKAQKKLEKEQKKAEKDEEKSRKKEEKAKRKVGKEKMDPAQKKGFFSRWFGAADSPSRQQVEQAHSTTQSAREDFIRHQDPDFATIEQYRRDLEALQERDGSVPAGPRVHFSDEPRTRAESAHPPPQRRPYFPSDQRSAQAQRKKDLHSSSTALDEATADLLRLSAEPSPVLQRATQKLTKAASTSSVQRTIQTKDGGALRPGPIMTWDTNRTTDSEASEVEMLTSRGRTRGRADAPPPGQRQGHSEDDTLDLSEWSMTVTASDAIPFSHQSPPNGRSAFSKALPIQPGQQFAQSTTTQQTHENAHVIRIQPVQHAPPPLAQKQQQQQQQQQYGVSPQSGPSRDTSTDGRQAVRETEAVYEKQTKGPPVVRTTVEGKLRMEKIVGADLITVDSCVSSAWTVRDTVTHYKIKTTIGKRSLIVEEGQESKFRITLIENGETKAEREATLDVPEGQSKKDYLTEVSKKLLTDLNALDEERLTAVTHVEIEVIEDVTNILKTYVIGERADEFYEQVGDQVPAIETFHVEDHVDRTPSPLAVEKSEKIYVDRLEFEEGKLEPEKAEYHLEKEGIHYEGEGTMRRLQRHETEQGMDESVHRERCAHVFADCDLVKREDTSDFTVRYAVPLVHMITFALRHQRLRREERSRHEMEQKGKRFQEEITVRRAQRYETEEEQEERQEEKKEAVQLQQAVQQLLQNEQVQSSEGSMQLQSAGQQIVEQQDFERVIVEHGQKVMSGGFEMEIQGQELKGDGLMKRQGRVFDSEDEEEVVEVIQKVQEAKQYKAKFIETEAEGGQYSMQQEGIELKGAKRIRKVQRFESDSSEEMNGGSPTLVDLTKKESHSVFELTIEIANETKQEVQVKRAERKKETINFMTSLSKFTCEQEEVTKVWSSKAKAKETYRARELGEEHAIAVIYLQKRPGLNDQSAEGIAKTPNRGSASFTGSAFQERSWSSTLSLSRGVKSEMAQSKVSEVQKSKVSSKMVEYGDAVESCAVVMKNTGTLHGQAHGELVEEVTDINTSSSTSSASCVEITKSLVLQNFRALLPLHGHACHTCPLVAVRSLGFHLSSRWESIEINDELLSQEVRLRRKEQRAEITVFYVLRRVWGNYQHALKKLRLAGWQSYEERWREEERLKAMQRQGFDEWRSRSETHSYATYESDEYVMDTASTHIVTGSKIGRFAKFEVLHEKDEIREYCKNFGKSKNLWQIC